MGLLGGEVGLEKHTKTKNNNNINSSQLPKEHTPCHARHGMAQASFAQTKVHEQKEGHRRPYYELQNGGLGYTTFTLHLCKINCLSYQMAFHSE